MMTKLANRLETGETALFSGHTQENANQSVGVALKLSKEAEKHFQSGK